MYEAIQRNRNERSSCKDREGGSREMLPIQPYMENAVRYVRSVEPSGGVIQRTGEEQAVLDSADVRKMRRGNYIKDIIDTKGMSYYLVPRIKKMLDEIYVFIQRMAEPSKPGEPEVPDEIKTDAQSLIDRFQEMEPFIHAMAVRYLGVGNCLDFSRVVYAKLVEKNYGKWIYRCYLERMEVGTGKPLLLRKRIIYPKGKSFDVKNAATYAEAKIENKGQKVSFEQYLQGENQFGIPIQILGDKRQGEPKDMGDSWMVWYIFEVPPYQNLFDHAFVVTSGMKVRDAREFNPGEAVVVDGWRALPAMPLGVFLAQRGMTPADVKIGEIHQSTGPPFTYPWLEETVKEVVGRHIAEVQKEVQDIAAQRAEAMRRYEEAASQHKEVVKDEYLERRAGILERIENKEEIPLVYDKLDEVTVH